MTGLYLHPLRLAALSEGRLSVLRVPVTKQTSRVTSCPWEYLGWKMVWIDPGLGDGPYLKVSAKDGETVHRVYPRMGDGDYFAKEVFRVSWCAGSKARGYLVGVEYKSTWDGHRDPHGKVFNLPEMHYCGKLTKSGTGAWQSPLTMPEKFARYILTLGPPVPGKLGDATMEEIGGEGVYFPPPYVGVNYEDGSAIEHPDIAMDPWQHHERFWNTIYPRHPWSPDRWTWAYPVRRSLR